MTSIWKRPKRLEPARLEGAIPKVGIACVVHYLFDKPEQIGHYKKLGNRSPVTPTGVQILQNFISLTTTQSF
jgi:hypothetical protein